MEKSIVTIMSEVVNACSNKWSDPEQCTCECDSNWMTNMYLDYMNNYISYKTFAENEVMTRLDWNSFNDRVKIVNAVKALLDLFHNIGYCQSALSYERVGEICIKILKGEL